MAHFISIENVTGSSKSKVRQDLRYKTGNITWKIKFSSPLNPATVNNRNLYVTSMSNVPLKSNIRYDSVNNIIEIEPLEPYERNVSYLLHITTNVKSKGGKALTSEITLQFKV